MNEFLTHCRATIGDEHVLTDTADMAGFLIDYRQRFTGKALAVLRPSTTEEVAAIVRLCNRYRVPVVPQGGNTGLVLGSVPDASGTAIVLSLTRLNRIRKIDTVNNTMTVEAGCILKNVQDAAAEAGRLYPLHLASESSCTIGGNLSANAGGAAVLRYGNARELCLGLEVVTPQGEIWSKLRGLRKDNTGYDLRDLFIGAEGTLGIITAAVLKLFPRPKAILTALAAMNSPHDAQLLLSRAQTHCDASLTGFELMSNYSMQLVHKHFPQLYLPLPLTSPQYVLLELSDSESEQHGMQMLERFVGDALEAGEILDATVASSIAQSKAIWLLREYTSAAQALEGKNVKHDISVAPARIAEFIATTDALLQQHFPACRMVTFGHLGDGNLHYNVSAPEGVSPEDFILRQAEINRVVYDSVYRFEGSVAAEHGIGALKRNEIRDHHSNVEIQLMQKIKQALDPDKLMNPGKVV
ncbi:MAG: FAD-binding oxidoreductase [Burkholderiaceae bacterium]|nr:FAD-binding oxidoreductase [Burkholderiaceae bacterium]